MVAPVLLFGSLRSGTTLLRLMVNSHGALANNGEADFLFDHIQQNTDGTWTCDKAALARGRIFKAADITIDPALDGKPLIEDLIKQLRAKQPDKQLSINIHRGIETAIALFPDAKVIHLLRDPRDVARSSIPMGFAGNLYYGVNHWIDTEAEWQRSEPHIESENICTLRYEDLVRSPETELARLCQFLNVPMSDTMLDFHKHSTYQPLDARLAEQWRRKMSAQDIRLVESRAAALMEALGYPLNESKVFTPSPVYQRWLTLDHKIRLWRFNVKRFGFGLWLSGFLARRIGSQAWRNRVNERYDKIVIRHLK